METVNISEPSGPFNPWGRRMFRGGDGRGGRRSGTEHAPESGLGTHPGKEAPQTMSFTPVARSARATARPGTTLRPTLLASTLTASLVLLALALAPAPASAQSACGGFYRVDQGDTLVEVARVCGVTLPALLAENAGVKDDRDFEVGHRLRIPDPRSAQPTPVQACGAFYSVRTGDTVAEIAAKCGLTIPLLIAANPPLPAPLGIHDGLHVRIPDVSRAAVEDPATVAAVRSQIILGDDAPEPAPEPAPVPSEDMVRVEGVLEEGRVCARIRDDDGDVFAIVGEISNAFAPGDRVVLMGLAISEHECAHSPALELKILYRAQS